VPSAAAHIDLSRLGWDDYFGSSFRHHRRGDTEPARVLRADRGVCTLLTSSGVARGSLAGGVLLDAARDPARLPCAGDWVVARHWPDRRTTVEAVLPRRTTLIRRTADKDASGQVLAANMDTVAVVEPVHPEPDDARIERLLALAWESGAQPVLVLSKCDTTDAPEEMAAQIAELAPDVPVLPVSVTRDIGLDPLRELAGPGRTLALLGRSGAGKSTLVNALAGADVMPVQAIRRADGKGRHTTAYRSLIPVPGGGAVLDTPGIRGVGLLDTAAGLDQAFADIAGLAVFCRFGDCRHGAEPGCAVQDAIRTGDLAERRFTSWRKLHHEVAVESARKAARPQAVGRRKRGE
jgi:ribosome biogenesis GTPase / thiamine phosphate phosphatase